MITRVLFTLDARKRKSNCFYSKRRKKAIEITEKADLIFLLDFGQIARLNSYANTVQNTTAKKVMIDHHQEPDESITDILVFRCFGFLLLLKLFLRLLKSFRLEEFN